MFKCWWRVCHFMFLKVHFSSTRPPDALTWSPEGARLAAAQWETWLRWWHHRVCHSIGRGRVRNMTRLVHLHWTSTPGHVPGSIPEKGLGKPRNPFSIRQMARIRETLNATSPCPPSSPPSRTMNIVKSMSGVRWHHQVPFLSLSFSFLICRTHLCKSVRDGRACNPWVFFNIGGPFESQSQCGKRYKPILLKKSKPWWQEK